MICSVAVMGLSGAAFAQQTSPLTTPTTIPAVTQAHPADADPTSSTGPTKGTTDPGNAVATPNSAPTATITASKTFSRGKKNVAKDDKVTPSKDTKKALEKEKKADVLIGQDSKLPDKQLYDKALTAMKKGHFDVARLDLQTMLNTYPDSQYQMRAKLAIADTWYKEGGTAALTQAESEYADFRVFFPNVPEAAEAQMRIGDIYFRQMDKPDRDYSKSMHAEEEYRRMLTDYPDSTLVPQAKQRLREVQEVLASREADIASYYATRENWAAVIARYQTVVDTYPLYSHMDDALIGLGDAYEAEARYLRTLRNLPEAGKAKLEALYDGQAADAYRAVVLEHSAAPHVEDARDRLAAMNLPIPVPTKEQLAASEALENSRATYKLVDVARLFIMHQPDTVLAPRSGEPTMTDPKPTLAPTVVAKVKTDFSSAFANAPVPVAATVPAAVAADATASPVAAAVAAPAEPAAPLAFTEVPVATDGGAPAGATSSFNTAAPAAARSGGNGIGVEILTPAARPTSTVNDTPGGLTAVGPKNAAPLPEVERAGEAPDRPNEVASPTPAAQVVGANGKVPKPEFDKKEESSSKHKKKKGLKKIVEPL